MQLVRRERLDFNLNQHGLNPQLANLHTGPNWAVRKAFFENITHNFESFIYVDVVAAHGVNVVPRQAAIDRPEGIFDVVQCCGYLSVDVGGDISVNIPAALARCLDDVADFDGLRIVDALGLGLGPGVVGKLEVGHGVDDVSVVTIEIV